MGISSSQNPLLGILFWICILIILFAIFEIICSYALNDLFINIGIPVIYYRKYMPKPLTPFQHGKTYSTKQGNFCFINENTCLFITRIFWEPLRILTPYPIKGKISWSDSQVKIVGRIPIGTILLTIIFFICSFNANDVKTTSVLFSAYILVFCLLFLVEKIRFDKIIKEIKESCSKNYAS